MEAVAGKRDNAGSLAATSQQPPPPPPAQPPARQASLEPAPCICSLTSAPTLPAMPRGIMLALRPLNQVQQLGSLPVSPPLFMHFQPVTGLTAGGGREGVDPGQEPPASSPTGHSYTQQAAIHELAPPVHIPVTSQHLLLRSVKSMQTPSAAPAVEDAAGAEAAGCGPLGSSHQAADTQLRPIKMLRAVSLTLGDAQRPRAQALSQSFQQQPQPSQAASGYPPVYGIQAPAVASPTAHASRRIQDQCRIQLQQQQQQQQLPLPQQHWPQPRLWQVTDARGKPGPGLPALLTTATTARDPERSNSPTGDGAEDEPDGDGGMPFPLDLSKIVLPPGPVEVTVAIRAPGIGRRRPRGPVPKSDGAGAEETKRYGYMRGPICGSLNLSRYLAGRDCILHDGYWMSRSNFEKLGGSKMAKWYRSIRVLPDLETLGDWLERHNLPVARGPNRRSSKRPWESGEEFWPGLLQAAIQQQQELTDNPEPATTLQPLRTAPSAPAVTAAAAAATAGACTAGSPNAESRRQRHHGSGCSGNGEAGAFLQRLLNTLPEVPSLALDPSPVEMPGTASGQGIPALRAASLRAATPGTTPASTHCDVFNVAAAAADAKPASLRLGSAGSLEAPPPLAPTAASDAQAGVPVHRVGAPSAALQLRLLRSRPVLGEDNLPQQQPSCMPPSVVAHGSVVSRQPSAPSAVSHPETSSLPAASRPVPTVIGLIRLRPVPVPDHDLDASAADKAPGAEAAASLHSPDLAAPNAVRRPLMPRLLPLTRLDLPHMKRVRELDHDSAEAGLNGAGPGFVGVCVAATAHAEAQKRARFAYVHVEQGPVWHPASDRGGAEEQAVDGVEQGAHGQAATALPVRDLGQEGAGMLLPAPRPAYRAAAGAPCHDGVGSSTTGQIRECSGLDGTAAGYHPASATQVEHAAAALTGPTVRAKGTDAMATGAEFDGASAGDLATPAADGYISVGAVADPSSANDSPQYAGCQQHLPAGPLAGFQHGEGAMRHDGAPQPPPAQLSTPQPPEQQGQQQEQQQPLQPVTYYRPLSQQPEEILATDLVPEGEELTQQQQQQDWATACGVMDVDMERAQHAPIR